MNKFFSTITLFYGVLFWSAADGLTQQQQQQESVAKERPNFIVVLIDDVGFGDYQCYNPQGRIETPAVDSLARQGMLFTRAHSPAALCAPSRYSMLTGNYSWRGRSPGGTWTFHGPSQILPGQKTVANLLQNSGYRTAMFGKAGIGGGLHASKEDGSADLTEPMVEGPLEWGFDYSYIMPLGHQSTSFFLENGEPAVGAENLVEAKGKVGLAEPDWDYEQIPHRLLDAADRFLDSVEQQARDTGENVPFFMHFCPSATHGPMHPPEEIRGRKIEGASGLGTLPDMVIQTDAIVDALVESLKRRGMYENTLICVTSDNGGKPSDQHQGHDAVGGLRGMKSTIFEGGTRVPFVLSWPQGIPAGVRNEQVVGIFDIIPTMLELAGADNPEDQVLDAVSLVKVFQSDRPDLAEARRYLIADGVYSGDPFDDGGNPGGPLFAARPRVFHAASMVFPEAERARRAKFLEAAEESLGLTRAFHDGWWKMIFDVPGAGSPVMLFNLRDDPTESRNLIDDPAQAERMKRMEQKYREMMASEGTVQMVLEPLEE